jgi:hypothetical protein
MLMAPENNSFSPDNTKKNDVTSQTINDVSVNPAQPDSTSNVPQEAAISQPISTNDAATDVKPPVQTPEVKDPVDSVANIDPKELDTTPTQTTAAPVTPSVTESTPSTTEHIAPSPVTPPSLTAPEKPVKAKKSKLKMLIVIVIFILLLGGASAASFYEGKHSVKIPVAAGPKPIVLPPQAIVTAACVPGRGKQYIIPKDIPNGPIYDVVNNKVIAIEYVIGVRALLSNPNEFSTTLLLLSKNYPVDHFTVVPVAPQPGDTDTYIHLIMFIVSKTEANSITCPGSSSSTSTGSSSSSSTSNNNVVSPPASSTTSEE